MATVGRDIKKFTSLLFCKNLLLSLFLQDHDADTVLLVPILMSKCSFFSIFLTRHNFFLSGCHLSTIHDKLSRLFESSVMVVVFVSVSIFCFLGLSRLIFL